jgi:hypothetical protein
VKPPVRRNHVSSPIAAAYGFVGRPTTRLREERHVRPEDAVHAVGLEQMADEGVAVRGVERRHGEARFDVEVALGDERVRVLPRRAREGGRARLRREAPRGVGLVSLEVLGRDRDAVLRHLDASQRAAVVRVPDRDARPDEVPVLERLDGHVLPLHVPSLLRRGRKERVAPGGGWGQLLQPAAAVEDVERRRAPVERGRRRLDP